MSLKVDTAKSLYRPITVELDGKEYEVKPLNRNMLRKMTEFEKRLRGGDAEAAYDQLELLFGTNHVFDSLDLRQVNDIIDYVTRQLFNPERAEKTDKEIPTEEKNVKGPGDKSSA